jgi:hypothetical protein
MVSVEISIRAWSAMRRDLVPGFCAKSVGISSRQNATRFVPDSAASAITTSLSGSSPKPMRVGVVPDPREFAPAATCSAGVHS